MEGSWSLRLQFKPWPPAACQDSLSVISQATAEFEAWQLLGKALKALKSQNREGLKPCFSLRGVSFLKMRA